MLFLSFISCTLSLAANGFLATITPSLLSVTPSVLDLFMKSFTALDMMIYEVSSSPADNMAVSSTYTWGQPKGFQYTGYAFLLKKNSTLVNATECLHPANIEVFVMIVLLQKLSH